MILNIEYHSVVSDRVRDDLRIVFLSEIHLREFGKGNSLLIADVTALQPELVVVDVNWY